MSFKTSGLSILYHYFTLLKYAINVIFPKGYVIFLIFIIPNLNIEFYDFNSKIIKTNYMKLFKPAFSLFLIVAIMLGSTSCLVFYPKSADGSTSGSSSRTASPTSVPTDNGGHKGWYKNRNNPHNPNTTNPKGKEKK